MSLDLTSFRGDSSPESVDARIELGRELLYGDTEGLYPLATELLDQTVDYDPLLPFEERHETIGTGATISLYRARSGDKMERGISIKRIIGAATVNTETDTITIPSDRDSFVSPEHRLHRLGAHNPMPAGLGGRISKAPAVQTGRNTIIDPEQRHRMDHFLRDYLSTAFTIRQALNEILIKEQHDRGA